MKNIKGNRYLRESYIGHDKKNYRRIEKKEFDVVDDISLDMKEMMFFKSLI